jgi:hypothetical protein
MKATRNPAKKEQKTVSMLEPPHLLRAVYKRLIDMSPLVGL